MMELLLRGSSLIIVVPLGFPQGVSVLISNYLITMITTTTTINNLATGVPQDKRAYSGVFLFFGPSGHIVFSFFQGVSHEHSIPGLGQRADLVEKGQTLWGWLKKKLSFVGVVYEQMFYAAQRINICDFQTSQLAMQANELAKNSRQALAARSALDTLVVKCDPSFHYVSGGWF